MAGQPFRGSDFPFPNSNLRQVAHVLRPSRCSEGGHAGGLEGPKPPGAAPAQAQVAHVLQPSTCGEGGGAGALEGPEALGATRALTWPQAAFGIYSRCFLHCFAHVHRRRKPSAPGAFCTVLLMEQVAEATCIFVQKALKWPKSLVAHVAIATCASATRPLQARVRERETGGTTRVRWCGACYLGPSLADGSTAA